MLQNLHKYFNEALNYWQYKVIGGLVAVIFTDDFFKLLLIFVCLEMLDIFTRWIALSRRCFKDLYPQTPCGLWRAVCFMWQSRKWRYIRSTALRDGFADKMLVYLLLLLTGAFVDGAFAIGHSPKVLTTIIVVVLASTEALSILENLSECQVTVISQIKAKFEDKIK